MSSKEERIYNITLNCLFMLFLCFTAFVLMLVCGATGLSQVGFTESIWIVTLTRLLYTFATLKIN